MFIVTEYAALTWEILHAVCHPHTCTHTRTHAHQHDKHTRTHNHTQAHTHRTKKFVFCCNKKSFRMLAF